MEIPLWSIRFSVIKRITYSLVDSKLEIIFFSSPDEKKVSLKLLILKPLASIFSTKD
jgi:hypothetical protein